MMSDIDFVLGEEPCSNSDIKVGVGFSFRPIEMENTVEVKRHIWLYIKCKTTQSFIWLS